MKPMHRSLAGLAIAVLALPAFLGLMACLPVPIGDPEKSRIDPDLTGIWHMAGGSIVLLEPFDKHVWLMTGVSVEFDSEECPLAEGEEPAVDTFDAFIGALGDYGDRCFWPDQGVVLYKAWITRLGGQTFMVWEPKGTWFDEYGFKTPIWFTFRLDKISADRFTLAFVDADYFKDVDGFDALLDNIDGEEPNDPREVRRVARKVERVIRRNVADPELYDEDDPGELTRIPAERVDDVIDIVEQIIGSD